MDIVVSRETNQSIMIPFSTILLKILWTIRFVIQMSQRLITSFGRTGKAFIVDAGIYAFTLSGYYQQS